MDNMWVCESCKSLNRANDEHCYKCRAPRVGIGPVSAPPQGAPALSVTPTPMVRFCLHCGAALPEGASFCGSCGVRVAGQTLATSAPALRPGQLAVEPKGANWPRIAVFGVLGVATAAILVSLALVGGHFLQVGSATSAPTLAGSLFRGDGYSILVPSTADWQYQRITTGEGEDMWTAQTSGGAVGFSVITVTNLLPGEQNLEGALGRMQNAWSSMGAVADGDAQLVTLPSGSAYRQVGVDGAMTIVSYAFYRNGRVLLLTGFDLDLTEIESIAEHVSLD